MYICIWATGTFELVTMSFQGRSSEPAFLNHWSVEQCGMQEQKGWEISGLPLWLSLSVEQ